MACACRKPSRGGQGGRRALLPKVPFQATQQNPPQPNLPFNQNPQVGQPAAQNPQDAMTTERRRIDKLRRDAIRRSLGVA